MATRRTTRRGRAPRKRAVWINIPFANVNFTESVGNQDLLVPEDWEASFTGLTQEHAVLRAVVGQISFVQATVGTSGGCFFWGIYMAGANETTVPTFTTSGMSEVIWLTTGQRPTSTVVTQSATIFMQAPQDVKIVAKRKLDTRTKIAICAQYGSDAASPAASISGLLRFLVARD